MPEVIFNGAEGRIEAKYHHSQEENPPVALILHPHPLHGGTMNNKVTYNMYKTFADQGFSVLRFNFRGVGRSEGKFDDGVGELADATTAMDWLQAQNPNSNIFWIAGFSFGSWIALQLVMRRPEIIGFIAVSPPMNKYDFSFLVPCPAPGLIIQGDSDNIVPEEYANKLYTKLSSQRAAQVDYSVINGADHFFEGKLDEFNNIISEYIYTKTKGDKEKMANKKIDRRRRKSKNKKQESAE